jgi:hypothetical protein
MAVAIASGVAVTCRPAGVEGSEAALDAMHVTLKTATSTITETSRTTGPRMTSRTTEARAGRETTEARARGKTTEAKVRRRTTKANAGRRTTQARRRSPRDRRRTECEGGVGHDCRSAEHRAHAQG